MLPTRHIRRKPPTFSSAAAVAPTEHKQSATLFADAREWQYCAGDIERECECVRETPLHLRESERESEREREGERVRERESERERERKWGRDIERGSECQSSALE